MEVWQITLIVMLIALTIFGAVLIAYGMGHASGRAEAARLETDETPDVPAPPRSLFGDDMPVRDTERKLIEVLPQSVIVVNRYGAVRFASAGAQSLGVITADRLDSEEIEDILAQTATDGDVREREVRLLVTDQASSPSSGRGIEAGQSAPSNTRYLRVRIGSLGGDLYVILIDDISDQRRFEAMRRDFVTNVSHELKTPAGAISLLAETITDAADDPDAVRYFSGRISKESTRLTELVHHLIDLQKAQSQQGMMNATTISAVEVARNAIAANQVQADARHVEIRLTVDGESVPTETGDESDMIDGPAGRTEDGAVVGADDSAEHMGDDVSSATAPLIRADKEAIETAVKNLVENAIHYSPEHTVVGVGVGERDGKVTIRVVDQGIGIPAQSLDRVFERFYRVDPARSRETGGSGLGLAITKHCVQENGGTIAVWSHEGEGSTFTIEMPAVGQ